MAADLTPERRAMLRALYEASTHRSEPWYADCLIGRGGSAPHSHFIRAGSDDDDAFVTPMKDGMRPEDVAFCVEAHAVFPDLLDLADEADALRAEVERLREGVECHVARPGEGTYECRLDRKCPACRLRDAEAEVERLRAEVGETFGMAFARAEALGRAEAEVERLRAMLEGRES